MKIDAGPALARAEPVPMMRPASRNVLKCHRLTTELLDVHGALTANSASESDHTDLASFEPSMKTSVVCAHRPTVRRWLCLFINSIANLFEPRCGIGIPIQCASKGSHVKKIRFVHKKM